MGWDGMDGMQVDGIRKPRFMFMGILWKFWGIRSIRQYGKGSPIHYVIITWNTCHRTAQQLVGETQLFHIVVRVKLLTWKATPNSISIAESVAMFIYFQADVSRLLGRCIVLQRFDWRRCSLSCRYCSLCSALLSGFWSPLGGAVIKNMRPLVGTVRHTVHLDSECYVLFSLSKYENGQWDTTYNRIIYYDLCPTSTFQLGAPSLQSDHFIFPAFVWFGARQIRKWHALD